MKEEKIWKFKIEESANNSSPNSKYIYNIKQNILSK